MPIRMKYITVMILLLLAIDVSRTQDPSPLVPFVDTADIDWSPDGSLVLVGLFNDGIRMIDSATGAERLIIPPEQARYVSDVAFNPDGTQFVASKEGVTIWDVTTGKVIHQLSGYQFGALGVVWGRDGEFVAFGGYRPYIWYPETGKTVFFFEGGAMEETGEVAVSPDNLVLVTIGSFTKFWDLVTQSETFRFENNNLLPVSVMWSRDGKRLLFGGYLPSLEGFIPRVRIVDSTTGAILKQFEGYDHILQAKWSPDETEILVPSRTGRVYLTDVASGTTRILTETGSAFTGAAWSPYGGRVAVGTVPGSNPVVSKGTAVSAAFATGVQIIVPAPTIDRLNAIAELCVRDAATQSRAVTGLTSQRVDSLDALPDFVAQVESLPEGAIPAACRADLLAVADALR